MFHPYIDLHKRQARISKARDTRNAVLAIAGLALLWFVVTSLFNIHAGFVPVDGTSVVLPLQ